MDAATGNERQPTIARRYAGTCSRCDEDERIRWRPGRSATGTIAERDANRFGHLYKAGIVSYSIH